MIEIDDRVVMLLFILFLGYMLFNRREGFNVGSSLSDCSNRGRDCLDDNKCAWCSNGDVSWRPGMVPVQFCTDLESDEYINAKKDPNIRCYKKN